MDHPPQPGILPALRAATGDAHQQLEDAVAIERCLADLTQYQRLLEIFHGFYGPLEALLFRGHPWQESELDISGRYKTPWIEDDLLGLGLPRPDLSTLPVCDQLPPSGSPSQAFGCLYVLEGATLGGRHISAMMGRSNVPPTARRFFAGYGEQTGERWREFGAALERHAAGAGSARGGEIIQGARETFACLHRWHVRHYATHEFPG